eukprot:scaffold274616_cov21-Tisochrysis_lutea.AAC.2
MPEAVTPQLKMSHRRCWEHAVAEREGTKQQQESCMGKIVRGKGRVQVGHRLDLQTVSCPQTCPV